MSDLSQPAKLRRLIEESGGAFAVVEEAVEALRTRLASGQLDPNDPDVIEVLRQHLLAIGSPSDVVKYFSLELLERVAPDTAVATYVEVVEALARSPLSAERTYPVERAMIRLLADKESAAALPALALLAGREVFPLSRTAARAVARIVGSSEEEAITERLSRNDLPEASQPDALSAGVGRALFPAKKSRGSRSSQERRRQEGARAPLPGGSEACLRPETASVRQRRLRSILLQAGRDPSRCGNCDQAGPTRIAHVVPADRGGTDRPGNLVSLCASCRRRLPRQTQEAFENEPARPRRGGRAEPQLDLF